MFQIIPTLMTNGCLRIKNQTNPKKSLKVGIEIILSLS